MYVFDAIKTEEKMIHEAQKLFTEDDMRPDEQREDRVFIYTNEALIAQHPDLHVLSKHYKGKKTHLEIARANTHTWLMLHQRDAMSMQETVALVPTSSDHREREWMAKNFEGATLRIETSK